MSKKAEIFLIGGIALVSLFFALYRLKESPPVWYDEGFYTQSAANLAKYGVLGLQVAPNNVESSSGFVTVGFPMLYPLAYWMKVFGVSVLSARSFMVLFIMLFISAAYFLSKNLFDKKTAIMSLALMASLPTLYGNGKSVLGEVPGLFYLFIFLLFFEFGLKAGKKWYWFSFSAFSAGLCLATKPLFLVLLPAIFVGVFLEWKRGKLGIREISIMILFCAIPLVVWFFTQFQDNESLKEILNFYANPYQITDLGKVVFDNFKRLFTNFGTIYLLASIIGWLAAIFIRWRSKTKISSAEIISLLFSLLITASYFRTAGWFRYLFPAQVISLLFLPNAMSVCFKRFFKKVEIIIPAAVLALFLLGLYQLGFGSWVAESYQYKRTEGWENYMRGVSSSTVLFFYDVPELVVFSPHENFYQYIKPSSGQFGEDNLLLLQEGKADKVFVESNAYKSGNRKNEIFKFYEVESMGEVYAILKKR